MCMARSFERYAGALLRRDQWMDLGVHSRDLASPTFTAVFPGFHTLTDHPASLNAMAWALQNRIVPGSVLSHSTAALMWGIPIPMELDGGVGRLRAAMSTADGGMRGAGVAGMGVPLMPVHGIGETLRETALPVLHCRVPKDGVASAGRGVVIHRLRPAPSIDLRRLKVSTPPEVLLELATCLPLWDLVAAIDGAIGPHAPYRRGPIIWSADGAGGGARARRMTLDGLRALIDGSRGRAGIKRLREATALARAEVRSPGETLCRLIITAAGLPEPTPNLRVEDPRTGQVRLLDLAWEDIGLALEYDGDGHRTKEQWRRDEARRDELASRGWTLARATGADTWRPQRMLERLARTMGERGVPVPCPQELRAVTDSVARSGLSMQIARHR